MDVSGFAMRGSVSGITCLAATELNQPLRLIGGIEVLSGQRKITSARVDSSVTIQMTGGIGCALAGAARASGTGVAGGQNGILGVLLQLI